MTEELQLKKYEENLLFLPLGGAGEIGMNLNLYHLNGRWIIVELGLGFADGDTPGTDIILPNINFILEEIANKVDAIIITHAHEDHIGAIPYLWSEIKCPIYTTKFTALIIKKKVSEHSSCKNLKIMEVQSGQTIKIGGFDIEFVPMHHSIPEMQALYIKTSKGNIFHTGDWRFANPHETVDDSNREYLKEIGRRDILALVGDSTNILHDEAARSESDLGTNLEQIISNYGKSMVLVTTFASNVARLESIFNAAKKTNRKVFLLGRSLQKIFNAAQESGYLKDMIIGDEKEIGHLRKEEILVMCTGCQGEVLAALSKIALGKHHYLTIGEKDLVLFSSKIIPGNEKKIYDLYNQLTKLGVKILNEHNEFVHVSGHPSRAEVRQMYSYIKPQIAIPVHGEALHLHEHCRVARDSNVPHVINVTNGSVVILDHDKPSVVGTVESGRYTIDGNVLLESTNDIFAQRKVMMQNGIIIVNVVLNKESITDINIYAPGLLNEEEDVDLFEAFSDDIRKILRKNSLGNTLAMEKEIQRLVKKRVRREINKFPIVKVYLYRKR